jgi:hypothetical protein
MASLIITGQQKIVRERRLVRQVISGTSESIYKAARNVNVKEFHWKGLKHKIIQKMLIF